MVCVRVNRESTRLPLGDLEKNFLHFTFKIAKDGFGGEYVLPKNGPNWGQRIEVGMRGLLLTLTHIVKNMCYITHAKLTPSLKQSWKWKMVKDH